MALVTSTKKGSVTKKPGMKRKQMSGCISELKDDKIVPIPSEFDLVLTKFVKEYSFQNKSKWATSTNADTDEKVIGHTERVKCEQDVKLSIAELYKEGSQRQ